MKNKKIETIRQHFNISDSVRLKTVVGYDDYFVSEQGNISRINTGYTWSHLRMHHE